VTVRVAYSSVNYKDALAATGKGKILRRASCIGGIDFSGTVVSSGDGRFAKGDAVLGVGFDIGVAHHGGYAQYARVPAGWLTKLPQGMSLWDAMAFGTAGYAAGAVGNGQTDQRSDVYAPPAVARSPLRCSPNRLSRRRSPGRRASRTG
jgi:NADPH:quinone reductase-like Zn-dependent oxidoreductase